MMQSCTKGYHLIIDICLKKEQTIINENEENLFSGEVVTDPGKGFWSNTNIRGNHMLRYAIDQHGEFNQKVLVFFFRRQANAGMDPVLGNNKAFLQDVID